MKKRLLKVLSIDTLILLLLLGYYYLNKYFHIGIPCLFYKITSFKCPGCGITRMLFSILKLDFKSAFFYNPVVFILLPFLTFYIFYQEYIYITKRKNKLKVPDFIYYLIIFILIIFGILRNII